VKRTPAIKTSDNKDIFDVINVYEEGADQKIMQSQSHDRVRMMLELLPEEQKRNHCTSPLCQP
jgi:RNA polymerase sigma-70 factor (ECF subfamily)